MRYSKANVVWKLLLSLIFLRPFICQMCYPRLDIYYCSILSCVLLWLLFSLKVSFKNHLNHPVLLLLIALAISTLFSMNLHSSLNQVYKFIPYLLAFYLMSKISLQQKREVLITLVSAGFLLGLHGIYQFFWGFQHILDYLHKIQPYLYAEEFLARKRVFATFLSPNMFAGYLIIILPLATGLLVDAWTKKKQLLCLLTGFSLFFMFISLLLSKSLGGWVSLFIAFLVFSLLLFVQSAFSRRKIFFIIVIIGSIIISILAGILIIRTEQFLDPGNPQNSFRQRLLFWQATIKMIKDFPLTGVGPGNFRFIYPIYKRPQALETRFVHNSYLQIWAEMGILGIVAWIWLIIKSFKVAIGNLKMSGKRNYLTTGLLAASSAFLIHNLFDFDFFLPEVAFQWWVILGLISFWPANKNATRNLS